MNIPLQVRSVYTMLGSTIQLPELIAAAQANGLSQLCLVEDNSLHSGIKFYKACQKAGIKPILGLSLKVYGEGFHDYWTLLAKNETGYRALLHLASHDQLPLEDAIAASNNLVICTHGEQGLLPALAREQSLGGDKAQTYYENYLSRIDDLYIGISRVDPQTLETSRQLLRLGNRLGVPVCALDDIRYLKKEDAPRYSFLKAIKDNEILQDLPLTSDRSFASALDLAGRYPDCPEAGAAAEEIAAKCHLTLQLGKTLLPKFPLPQGQSSSDYLRALCQKGLAKRYGASLGPLHRQRLLYELEVIGSMGFSDYFLIVWDFIKYARQQGILVGPGRGSAAGSLVAYVLGITNVDPLKYGLLFERFLNPERLSMPDIDIDFQDTRRDEVIAYVHQRYGHQQVVQIATFGTFQSKSAWRDLARIHGIETNLINQVAAFIYSGSSLSAILEQNEALREFFKSYPRLEAIFRDAMKLEGIPRHTSIHAAGIMISDGDLRDHTPLMAGPLGIQVSQYEAEDLEAIGLLKMDFLGLKNLTMLQGISNLIRERVDPGFNLASLGFGDPATYEAIANARTTGVFQLESEGMRQVLRAVRPAQLEDVVACNALFRPGPMENIPLFAARKHGREKVEYLHPSLEPILSYTYGIIVYQEQIMQIASTVSGYSLGEADVLRRAVSKKDAQVLLKEGERFMARAQSRGYSLEISQKLFDLILKFANYGFNRSHAVAYSMIAYQMAYLKVHFPAFFMAVSLSNVTGSERATGNYVKEAKQLGLEIRGPSVNHSGLGYEPEDGAIRFSLLPIKHVGYNLAKQIIETRQAGPYQDFYDFVIRTKSFLGSRIYECLIDAGALDEFGHSRATLHENLVKILDFSKYDGGLFEMAFEVRPAAVEFEAAEVMAREKELLGFYLTSHPLSARRQEIKAKGWFLPSELSQLRDQLLTCVGLVEKVRQIRDKNGNLMAFMDISDEETTVSVIIFSKQYESRFRTLAGKVIAVKGILEGGKNGKIIKMREIIAIT